MADPRLPPEMDAFMTNANWGPHHVKWHLEQQYDIWHHRERQGDSRAAGVIAFGEEIGWAPAEHQEGAPGHGLRFLAMHRAMFQLLLEALPQHSAWLAGWPTPPQDPADAEDPVPGSRPFDPDKAAGVVMVETRQAEFASEDDFALFLETDIRPVPDNPEARSADRRTGLHNWLHNRWTDRGSSVNLGNPEVNLFNARFWRMHGWIDRLWTGYRLAHGLSDEDPEYRELIAEYRAMMDPHGGHHDHLFAKRLKKAAKLPAALETFFAGAE
ncbi:MAG TPA: hypothetical protein VNI02_09815 [Blastocatellia bacterium]|nr:hypothetical protein [Blastocatellia bacterium]